MTGILPEHELTLLCDAARLLERLADMASIEELEDA